MFKFINDNNLKKDLYKGSLMVHGLQDLREITRS